MEGIVKTVHLTDGIKIEVKDKHNTMIVDRIVSDTEEIMFVDEGNRKGKKEKKVKKKEA